MNITSLTLRNFVCYRGEHELALEAKPYAVLARSVDDARRSNWLGKSTLLESIWFALYGEHRWPNEDAWITYGEQEGGVRLMCGSVVIERSRIRGSATKLTVMVGGNTSLAKGDEAQRVVDELLGLDKHDFEATCFWRQKRMSRFVVASPAERLKTVVGWLRLEKLDECIAHATNVLARAVDGLSVYQARFTTNQAVVAELLKAAGVGEELNQRDAAIALARELEVCNANVGKIEGAVASLNDDSARVTRWKQDETASASYADIVQQGKQLKEWLDKREPADDAIERLSGVKARESHARTVYDAARRDCQQKEQLRRGQFSGECPVAGIQCPVTDDINRDTQKNAKLYQASVAAMQSAREVLSEAQRITAEAETARRAIEDAELKLTTLREQAKKQHNAANRFAAGCPVQDHETLPVRMAEAQLALGTARNQVEHVQRAIARFDELMRDNAACLRTVGTLKAAVETAREAQLVFRRARQRIAEGALGSIEQGANVMLVETGIDLSLTARWQREGDGLATACDACGAAFGASRRVKVCARCGTERGPKMVNRLELVLSNNSGAAEDLAGGVFQLSASAWLRHKRACGWSVALIDEPFGALDDANRESFAAHLGNIVRGQYGFDQAFVISHSPQTLGALPGRIEIVSDGKYSTPRVVS